MHREYRLSVITVNYNGLRDTCSLLDHLTFDHNDTEVIVVDNGSANNEAETIASRYANVKCIRSERNLGFAGGNNLGISHAQGKYLFFVNNDTEVSMDDIERLINRIETSEHIGIVCPKIRFFYGDRHIQYAGFTPMSRITCRNRGIGYNEADIGQYDTPRQTAFAHGAAMMARRDTVNKVGLIPECYFLYYEEMDWSMMMKRNGYQIWYEPSATVYHKESQSTGANSPLKTYYLTRNRLLFIKRNSEHFRLLSYLYMICIVATRDILKNILCAKPKLAQATIKGVIDFLKN